MDFNSRVAARLQAHDAQLEKTRAPLTEATTALAEVAHDAATDQIHARAFVAARAGEPGALHATMFEGRPAWVQRHATRDAVTVLLPADAAAFAHAGTTPRMDAAAAATLSLELLSFNGSSAEAFGTLASLAVLLEPGDASTPWLTRANAGGLADPRLPRVMSTSVLGPARVEGALHVAVHVDFERATRRVVLGPQDRAGYGMRQAGSTRITIDAACEAQAQPYRFMLADPQWQASLKTALAVVVRERLAAQALCTDLADHVREREVAKLLVREDGRSRTSFHWSGAEFRPRFFSGSRYTDYEVVWIQIDHASPLNRALYDNRYWERTVYKPERLLAAVADDSVAFADRMAILDCHGGIRVEGLDLNSLDRRVLPFVAAEAAASGFPEVVSATEHGIKVHIPRSHPLLHGECP